MYINDLLLQQGVTKYSLSKHSGVPYSTVSDILSGKTSLQKSSAETVYRLAKSLGVSMEELIEAHTDNRCSFELFKSNVCHKLKRLGDIDFLMDTLQSNEIELYYKKKWYPEAFYLLAMVDYISRENHVKLCTEYDALRKQKLREIIFPSSVVLLCAAEKSDAPRKAALIDAIPEFMRFNIVESEVRNVV